MSDYKDFMSDNERLLNRLGYKYIGRDEFEGAPVYRRTAIANLEILGIIRPKKFQGITRDSNKLLVSWINNIV